MINNKIEDINKIDFEVNWVVRKVRLYLMSMALPN